MNEDYKTLISFKIDKHTFAITSLKVVNILPLEDNITQIPNNKDYVLGMLNFHGSIIPVCDLRKIMDFEERERKIENSILIISLDDKKESQIGIVVDSIKEVFDISLDSIKPSLFKNKLGLIDNFAGTINIDDDFIHLLDVNYIVNVIEN